MLRYIRTSPLALEKSPERQEVLKKFHDEIALRFHVRHVQPGDPTGLWGVDEYVKLQVRLPQFDRHTQLLRGCSQTSRCHGGVGDWIPSPYRPLRNTTSIKEYRNLTGYSTRAPKLSQVSLMNQYFPRHLYLASKELRGIAPCSNT